MTTTAATTTKTDYLSPSEARKLRVLRVHVIASLRLTLDEVAVRAEVAQSWLSRAERGLVRVSRDRAATIRQAIWELRAERLRELQEAQDASL
jgi:predicted transcriptional regulator